MTFQEFLKQFNDFLLNQCGMTNTLFNSVQMDNKKSIKSLFFNPYQSKQEFLYKAASVVSAPVCLSIIAIELASASLYLGIRTAVDLAKLDTRVAKIHLADAVFHMIFAFVAAITAAASPFINLVDFVGSGISTISKNFGQQEEIKPSFNCN